MSKGINFSKHLQSAPVLFLCLLAPLLLACPAAQAKVQLSPLFADGGVFQRDKPVNVFGTGRPGEIVTAEIGGNKGVCIIKPSGNFLISVAPPVGEGPFTLRVAGDNLVEVKDMHPGEVWIVAGDADVERDCLSTGLDGGPMPRSLQLFHVGVRMTLHPVRQPLGHWIKATAPGAMTFSALGMSFGRDLAKRVGGPIGIIQISCPETPIRAWISAGGLAASASTAGATSKNPMSAKDYEKLNGEYQESLKKWKESMLQAREGQNTGQSTEQSAAHQAGPPAAPPLPSPLLRNTASSVFNGMVASLTPYSVRGVVWYHGRSDLKESVNYKTFLPVFMKDLRQVFHQDGLPIILVQTGALADPQNGDDSPVSVLRQAQYKARVAPRTYMAVSLDLDRKDEKTGEIKTDLEALAQRLTKIALATQYHTPARIASPVIDTVEKAGDGETLKLQLRYADKGLQNSAKDIKGFTVSAWNRQFFEAEAQLEGNTILVQSKYVKDPKFVRYCWGNAPTITLFSHDGLPLTPYTSDR